MSKITELSEAVASGSHKLIESLVREALAEGVDASTILNEGMIEAMAVVGARFQAGEIFVPEILVAARTMKKGVEALRPYLLAGETGANGTVILGTVAGDLHDIGKNLVGMMIEGAGFTVIDLGVDVPAEKFVETVRENPDAKIVALSSLLTTTMPSMRAAVRALRAACEGRPVKIMVGGAPVTQGYCDEIGADAYAPDAASAAAKARELVA